MPRQRRTNTLICWITYKHAYSHTLINTYTHILTHTYIRSQKIANCTWSANSVSHGGNGGNSNAGDGKSSSSSNGGGAMWLTIIFLNGDSSSSSGVPHSSSMITQVRACVRVRVYFVIPRPVRAFVYTRSVTYVSRI